MKNYFGIFFILFLSLEIIFCEDNVTRCIGGSSSVDECKKLLSDNEKLNNNHCCLFTGYLKNNYDSECRLLDENEYENVDLVKSDFIDKGYTDVNIDCKSYYFSLNIVFCFLFILF